MLVVSLTRTSASSIKYFIEFVVDWLINGRLFSSYQKLLFVYRLQNNVISCETPSDEITSPKSYKSHSPNNMFNIKWKHMFLFLVVFFVKSHYGILGFCGLNSQNLRSNQTYTNGSRTPITTLNTFRNVWTS